MVHLDVGDGHFSRDVALGQPVVESIRQATRLELDVHLLIERPERYIADFARAGADRLAVHPESTPHLWRTLNSVRQAGAKAGIALQPGCPLSLVSGLLKEIDFLSVLLCDPECELDLSERPEHADIRRAGVQKLREAARIREQEGLRFELEAEGAIGPADVPELAQAGADILVTGFAIFQGGQPVARLRELIAAAERSIAPEPVKSREA
jgi:ribulose-phosphate 3-epimerase